MIATTQDEDISPNRNAVNKKSSSLKFRQKLIVLNKEKLINLLAYLNESKIIKIF